MLTSNTSHPWNRANTLSEFEQRLRPDHAYPAQKVAGVYIWGIHLDQQYFPYYVGKVGSRQGLYARLFQHVGELAGGLKTVYNIDQLYEKDFEPMWMKSNIMPLYTPSSLENLTTGFYQKPRVQRTVSDFIEHMFIAWTEVTEEKHRTQLERLVWQLLIQSCCPASNKVSGLIDRHYFSPSVQEPLSLRMSEVLNRFIKTTLSY